MWFLVFQPCPFEQTYPEESLFIEIIIKYDNIVFFTLTLETQHRCFLYTKAGNKVPTFTYSILYIYARNKSVGIGGHYIEMGYRVHENAQYVKHLHNIWMIQLNILAGFSNNTMKYCQICKCRTNAIRPTQFSLNHRRGTVGNISQIYHSFNTTSQPQGHRTTQFFSYKVHAWVFTEWPL